MTEAVNDTLKAIAASLLMEQVLAPRFEFRPKYATNEPTPGLVYGEGGYDPAKCNVGVHPDSGMIQLEIKGLSEPKTPEAARICREDLTELVTAFVQDKPAMERGMFDTELVPEELTQVRMGKIVKEKFPNLDEEDQETVRQHATAIDALPPVKVVRKWISLVPRQLVCKKERHPGGLEELREISGKSERIRNPRNLRSPVESTFEVSLPE